MLQTISHFRLVPFVFLLLSLVIVKSAFARDVNAQLTNLLDEIWQYELSQFPGLARSEGMQPESAFTDISMDAMTKRNDQFTAYLAQLDEYDEKPLGESERISLFMQKYRLQNYVDEFKFKSYRVPITSEFGFHGGIASNVTNFGQVDDSNLDRFLDLLNAIPKVMALNITYMREGIAEGHTQPKIVLEGFEESISAFINEEFEQHVFFAPVQSLYQSLSHKQKGKVKTAIDTANEAFLSFYNFFTEEYFPNAKTEIAAITWPEGEAYYNNRTEYFTTTAMTAEEIHQIGLQEVARIRAEMQAIVDKLEFDGDINAFIEFLRTDPQFYAKTPKELIVHASYIAKQMDAKLPRLFYKMPRTPYGVAPVPDSIAPKYTTGRYISPRRDDQPGYYWVNTYALDKRPLYAIPALTLHEAVPGHHFQISLAREMEDLPKVRQNTYISAFGEGWGLYSEYLGLEVGIYEDPYDDFGRLSYEMWRACRLVVDTGMHLFGWTRQQALDYMLENTALSEHNVRTEIDRYISWPTQALSYKIGEIKIKQLREEAEMTLQEKFDLRAFHDALLANGSVPLFILEEQMNAFIESNK